MVDSAFATDEFIRAQIAAWQRELGSVRRLADKTLEAYGRDLGQFLEFLAGHTGGPVSLAHAEGDARRRYPRLHGAAAQGDLGSRSLARALSAIKSFFRFLEREGVLATEALNIIRRPSRPDRCPRR